MLTGFVAPAEAGAAIGSTARQTLAAPASAGTAQEALGGYSAGVTATGINRSR